MYIAAGYGNVDILNMLIDAGGDVNIADSVSLYTIHVAGYCSDQFQFSLYLIVVCGDH